MRSDEVLGYFGVDPERGLTENEVLERQKRYGVNALPEAKPISDIRLFMSQFLNPLVYILVAAGGIALLLQEYLDGSVIFFVVGITVSLGFFQERKAQSALFALKKLIAERAHVLREGNEQEIEARLVVPGDIIIFEAGRKIPGDARIIESHNLEINEAILTGEWIPSGKSSNIFSEAIPIIERENMAYKGSIVEGGKGKAIIVSTGVRTEIGKIARILQETKEEKTPFQKKLSNFSHTFALIIGILAFVLFFAGVWFGYSVREMFFISVAAAVASIPEGLPAALTVILAIGMQRILKRKGLVRKLIAAETLGSTSIIAIDKTGTITEAKMQVAFIWAAKKELAHDGKKFAVDLRNGEFESHLLLLKIAALSNEAYIENPDDEIHEWIIRGRATDKALLSAAIGAGFLKHELEKNEPKIDELPFSSEYKYLAMLRKSADGENILYVSGAPERVVSMAGFVSEDGSTVPLEEEDRKKIYEKVKEMTGRGLRVVGLAYKKTSAESIDKNDSKLRELVFVGCIGLKDPVRQEAKETVRLCHEAGLRLLLVTGDHKETARALMMELGIRVEDQEIIEGEELEVMSDEELEKKITAVKMFARVEPHQKLKIVKVLQKGGEVVAMTGDGVNDALALKQADIGVALGSGTDVSKEISDLVILDDNLSTIVAAIEEGRVIADNFKKVLTFLLTGGFTEILLIMGSILLGLPLPLLPAQILWVNIVEDGLPSFALAFEKKEEDIMRQKPKNLQKTPLLDNEMKIIIFIIGIFTDLLLFLLFWLIWRLTGDLAHARTMIFAGLAIDSLLYIFSIKSFRQNIWKINLFSNTFLLFAIAMGWALLISAIYLSWLQKILRTEALGLADWGILGALGLINLVLIEIVKFFFIRKNNHYIHNAKEAPAQQ